MTDDQLARLVLSSIGIGLVSSLLAPIKRKWRKRAEARQGRFDGVCYRLGKCWARSKHLLHDRLARFCIR